MLQFDKFSALIPSPAGVFAASLDYGAFLTLLAVLSKIVPGRKHLGTPLKDGKRLTYYLNGFNTLVVVLAAWFANANYFRWVSPTFIVDNYGGFFAVANAWAFLLAVVLFVKGHLSGVKYEGVLHNFVLGSELNPRLLGLDMKIYALRPAMMGWVLLNLSFVAKHQQLNGGSANLPILLATGFQVLYVLDYFWFEEFMTSTWDIVAEHFGYMLVFGDYVFIPFAFTVADWYLVDSVHQLSTPYVLLCLATFVIGYVIFRGSNYQKHVFKHDPKRPIWGKPAETVGGKLLVSGFWGWARHTNYLGDLLLGLAWCLPCGPAPVWAYFYVIYLAILLVQRERRDDSRCREKYRELWAAYRKRVPYRIVPGLY